MTQLIKEQNERAEKFRQDMTKMLEDEIMMLRAKEARTKSDNDLRFNKHSERIETCEMRLDNQDNSF